MKSISTLCATSTVGAAAVGLAFGCVTHKHSQSADQPTNSSHQQSQNGQRSASAPLRPTKPQLTRPNSSCEPLQSSHLLDPNPSRPGTSAGLQTPGQDLRPRTSTGSSHLGATSGRAGSQQDLSRGNSLVVRKRRSRWLPKTSTDSRDSQISRQDSNLSLDVPSQHGGSSRSARLTKPNPSQRSLSSQLSSRTSENGSDTHSRSTSYAYGTNTSQFPDQQRLGPQQPQRQPPTEEEVPLKSYLQTLKHMNTVADFSNQKASQEDINHIRPSRQCLPYLVKPEALAPRPRRRLHKARAEKRRSILSFDFTSYFSPPEEESQEQELNRPRNRRSFSISDMLSGMSMSSKKSLDEPQVQRRKLQRPMNHRVASAPLLSHSNSSGTDRLLTPGLRSEGNRSTSAMASYYNSPTMSEDVVSFAGRSRHSAHPSEHFSAQADADQLPSMHLPQVDEHRPMRYSSATSTFTSSQLGSEMDIRVFSSGDEDEGDLRSDTAYDSIRTGMTGGSGPFPGSLFDKESGFEAGPSRSTSWQETTTGATSPNTMRAFDDVIFEEDENAMTPKKAPTTSHDVDHQHRMSHQMTIQRADSGSPASRKPLSLGKLKWDSDDDAWSDNGADEQTHVSHKALPTLASWSDEISGDDGDSDFAPPATDSLHPPGVYDHRKSRHSDVGLDSKSSLFDWSEHPPLERNLSDLPPRPKTVHGKKNTEGGRNSRPNNRRAPSGPHARSQSVPAITNEQLEPRTTANSKFGTWGVGMKGATEDWDDDFDFDEPDVPASSTPAPADVRADSGVAIVVPQAIREQQSNVLANISLLKEWGVLIEELKQLRLRAASLGLASEDSHGVFDEVDAMIDLADQEVDEPQFPKEQVSTSQWDETDDRRSSFAPSIPAHVVDDDVFGPLPSSIPSTAMPSPTRPRKNSEAIARTVIEAVQTRRGGKVPTSAQPAQSQASSKVPFDKGTLRHILPHLQGLVKSMKAILKDADHFGISPRRDNRGVSDPPFSQAFIAPSESPSRRCTPANGTNSPLRDSLTGIMSL